MNKYLIQTLLCTICCLWALTYATALHAEDAVQDILRNNNPVWYDSTDDNWRRSSGPQKNTKKSNSSDGGENEDDKAGNKNNSRNSSSSSMSGGASSVIMGILQVVIYTAIFALIITLIYLLLPKLMLREAEIVEKTPDKESNVNIEEFSPEDQIRFADPYNNLEQALLKKNWHNVIIYSYATLLLELHKYHIIRIRPGKTNRRYLREAQNLPTDYQKMMSLVITSFESTFFGHQDISQDIALRSHGMVKNIRKQLSQMSKQHA
ncbi:MAG: hypothetical protein HRU15_18540 [Planctomycetes bacterium]|nr:hypothetical protein [Planctomycetota bacterium]